MPKTIKSFNKVKFDWIMPVEERQQVEVLLATLGYRVDGGGTDLFNKVSEIFVRPKARSHKRKAATPKEVTS
jgi:hypothetical protein